MIDKVPRRSAGTERAARRVVLAGWYGAANLGDELILAVFVDWVREAGGSPVVISVNPHYTTAVHDAEAVGYSDLPAIVEAMAEADLVALGGGGLFQDYDTFDLPSLERFPARNVAQFAQFFYLGKEMGVPAAVLAQGVGPLRGTDARTITADVFNRAEACSVRDAESAALLRRIGVTRPLTVAPDPAWCFGLGEPVAPEKHFPALAGRRIIAMVVRDWPFDRSWEAPFVAAVGAALVPGWALLWLDFTRVPDAGATRPQHGEIAHRLIPQLPGFTHVVWEGMRVEEAARLIAGSDALLAMRLHGVLLGHLAGVPTVALEYDDKVRALGDNLGVPLVQRLPLDAIAARLPAAIRCVTGLASMKPFRLDATTRARLAEGALAHRTLLRKTMAAPPPTIADERSSASMLDRWSAELRDEDRRRVATAQACRRQRAGR